MDRVASLLVRSSELQRRLFASLPWGFRLASVFLVLADDYITDYAESLRAIFEAAGVKNIPDDLRSLAKVIYGKFMKQVGRPDRVEDAMQDLVVDLVKNQVIKPVEFTAAKSFLMGRVQYRILEMRNKGKKKEVSTTTPEGDLLTLVDETFESSPYWNEDPNQFATIEATFPEGVWEREVLPAVAKVHPDMMLYFQLLAEGHKGKHIVERGMLPTYQAEVEKKGLRSPWPNWSAKVQKTRKMISDVADRHRR